MKRGRGFVWGERGCFGFYFTRAKEVTFVCLSKFT